MKSIKIAGVPEHFNWPWKQAISNGDFEEKNIAVSWTDVPEGTGKMCQMLRDESTDIAVILTEGIVKDIIEGNPSNIVQMYVESPLIWGIHVAAHSKFEHLSQLENATVAISRIGSGSQLMAYVNASNQNWDSQKLKFEIVNTIDGAVDALTSGTADYFMWEHFMTKPLVDQGIFRRVADCPTPWPCFVIAVRNKLLQSDPQLIEDILSVINNRSGIVKESPNLVEDLAKSFNQKTDDITKWLSKTQWSQKPLSEDMLNKVQNQLLALSLIDKKGTFADVVKVF